MDEWIRSVKLCGRAQQVSPHTLMCVLLYKYMVQMQVHREVEKQVYVCSRVTVFADTLRKCRPV